MQQRAAYTLVCCSCVRSTCSCSTHRRVVLLSHTPGHLNALCGPDDQLISMWHSAVSQVFSYPIELSRCKKNVSQFSKTLGCCIHLLRSLSSDLTVKVVACQPFNTNKFAYRYSARGYCTLPNCMYTASSRDMSAQMHASPVYTFPCTTHHRGRPHTSSLLCSHSKTVVAQVTVCISNTWLYNSTIRDCNPLPTQKRSTHTQAPCDIRTSCSRPQQS